MIRHAASATDIADRLIVALDVPELADAERVVEELDGVVGFFKIGFWLLFKPGVDGLVDRLIRSGKRVFLDHKMYDIGETVRRGVAAVAARGVSMVTVHGDRAIMRAAVAGRGGSDLKVFAVSVLTSLDDGGLRDMGYAGSAADLVRQRVRNAAESGCDGVIASPADDPDALRRQAGRPDLLVATPGVRSPGDARNDHARLDTPENAVAHGADYLVMGRPILGSADRAAKARTVIDEMRRGLARRAAG